jgi:long-chain acyl-CoA synthetase
VSGNVADLPAAAAPRPEAIAIVDPDGSTTTWAELEARIAGVAAGLRSAGVDAADPVGVMLPNGSAFAAASWGALRAGASVVPINPAYTAPERDHILADAGVRRVITSGEQTAASWPEGVAALSPDQVSGDGPAPTGGGSDCAFICYTSGTTGRPKGARLSHDNILSNLDAFAGLDLLTLNSDDVLLGVLPFFHVFGLNVVLNAAARQSCTIVAVDRFSPRGTAEAITRHGITVAYGAPPVFAALASLPDEVGLPTLRAAVSGADALPVRTWDRFHARFGVGILEGYGLTETAPVLASNAAAAVARPGTVGVAVPGVDLRLVDPLGAPTAPGSVGEIQARGPNVFEGYHRRPAETAEVLRDGWFATGDLGSFDADGYLTIAGRLKDMIIVSGFNVYPREVEDVLLEHPEVADAAVVGMPDERTGERVRATVVLAPASELSADALLAHCRERLARYKLPRDVQFVSSLPRLASGKLARRALQV